MQVWVTEDQIRWISYTHSAQCPYNSGVPKLQERAMSIHSVLERWQNIIASL